VLATAVWLIASVLFSWYLTNFANYNATYGSLGAVIGFMMWTWLSVVILLFGAELNSEMEHQTARDTTTGTELPMGARGATMADTLGESRHSGTAQAKGRREGREPMRFSGQRGERHARRQRPIEGPVVPPSRAGTFAAYALPILALGAMLFGRRGRKHDAEEG
jgi:hypothetical protein